MTQPVDPAIAHLPEIELTQEEVDELGEYSCSIPTGTTIGKRWKRDPHAYGPDPVARAEGVICGTQWVIGEYIEDPDPKLVGIIWRRLKVKT